jgi:hypothetical protein
MKLVAKNHIDYVRDCREYQKSTYNCQHNSPLFIVKSLTVARALPDVNKHKDAQ